MAKGIKTGGRTKGTPNQNTKSIRDKFEVIINSFDVEDVIKDLKSLEPNERLKIIIAMTEYIAPKYQRVSHQINAPNDFEIKPIEWVVNK